MKTWRLITHHQTHLKQQAFERYWQGGFIALGWGAIGDLRELQPLNRAQIQRNIGNVNQAIPNYASPASAVSGGWCLWGLYYEMQIGDLVILGLGNGPLQNVVEVTGDYEWIPQPVFPGALPDADYQHIRRVKQRPDLNGRLLWEQHDGRPAPGWFIRRALIQLL
jgi:hypothetical protein